MTPWAQVLWWTLTLIGLAGSWLCSGLETGVYTLDRIRLRVRAGRTPPDQAAALLMHEIERTEDLLATLLIGNSIFGYLGAIGITELLAAQGYGDGAIVLLNALILTPVLLVFCEALPKELFRLESDKLTYALGPVLRIMRLTFTVIPAVPIVLALARALARALGSEGREGLTMTGGERVAEMLRESASAGVLSETQARLVDRALLFHRERVQNEMVPWASVRTLSLTWDRPRILRAIAGDPHSQFPVVDARGRVVGVVRHQDPFLRSGVAVSDLLREPARLLPSASARDALVRVRESAARVGIVERDGRPVGLVTEKDLIEPLAGMLE